MHVPHMFQCVVHVQDGSDTQMPDQMHRTLKTRAAGEGKSLSDYILGELRKSTEVPTMAEMRERLRSHESVIPFSTEEAVRAERDSR